MREILVRYSRRPSRVGVIVDIIAIIIELIVVRAVRKGPSAAERAIVAKINVSAPVNGAGSGDVENRSKGSGGNPFIPGSKNALQCETAP